MMHTLPSRFHDLLFTIAVSVAVGAFLYADSRAEEPPSGAPRPSSPSDSRMQGAASKPPLDQTLREELLARMAEDQEARQEWLRLMGRQEQKDMQKKIKLATSKLQAVDRKNLACMKDIVDRVGWPGKTLVGATGSQAAWLLVQHADSDLAFQKRCLALIFAAVEKGEARPEHLAYLTDRVRMAEKKKQVYGTQFHEVNGRQEPWPIENESDLRHRRKEVGLPPMAEYRKAIDEMYNRKN
jgi:hypothetical protein